MLETVHVADTGNRARMTTITSKISLDVFPPRRWDGRGMGDAVMMRRGVASVRASAFATAIRACGGWLGESYIEDKT